MVRGRWQSQRTARIYVNDGMAAEKEEHFSDATDSELASLGELTGLALNTLCPRSGGSRHVRAAWVTFVLLVDAFPRLEECRPDFVSIWCAETPL